MRKGQYPAVRAMYQTASRSDYKHKTSTSTHARPTPKIYTHTDLRQRPIPLRIPPIPPTSELILVLYHRLVWLDNVLPGLFPCFRPSELLSCLFGHKLDLFRPPRLPPLLLDGQCLPEAAGMRCKCGGIYPAQRNDSSVVASHLGPLDWSMYVRYTQAHSHARAHTHTHMQRTHAYTRTHTCVHAICKQTDEQHNAGSE